MRSLSSSMPKTFQSTIELGVSEARGASAEGQRPQQARFQRRTQRVALQQEDERRGCHGVQDDVAKILHCARPLRFVRRNCARPLHVTSFSVVGPPTGAESWRSICGPGLGGLPDAKPSSTLPKFSLLRSSYVSFQISTIGAFTQAPRHSTSSQLKLPSLER